MDGSLTYPIKDNNNIVVPFFIIFIMIGSVICINLFVAIIGMKFSEA